MPEIKELVKINPAEFEITEDTAKGIKAKFQPMLDLMVSYENDCNKIIEKGKDEKNITEELCNEAREMRLKLKKVRTGTDKIHKAEKKYYLQMGKAIDAFKNVQIAAAGEKETKLEAIEKYFENKEKEKIEKLYEERKAKLEAIEQTYFPADLGEMETEVWDNYYDGMKAGYDKKKEAEAEEQKKKEAFQTRSTELAKSGYGFDGLYFQYGKIQIAADDIRKASDEEFTAILDEAVKSKKSIDDFNEKIRLENEQLKKEAEEKEAKKKKDMKKRSGTFEKALIASGFEKTSTGLIHKEAEYQISFDEYSDIETDKELELLTDGTIKEKEKKVEEQQEIALKAKKSEDEMAAKALPDKVKLNTLARQIISIEMPTLSTPDADKVLSEVKTKLNLVALYIKEANDKL